MELEMVDRIFLGASHWSCGCLNTYHPRFECPSMSEPERVEHKARVLANPLFIGYDPASRGGDHSAVAVFSTHGESLYEECLATQDVPAASSVGSGDQEAARLCGSAVYDQFRRGKMFERARLVESDAYQATRRIGTAPVIPELEAANRTIAVLREGIDKANAEIMRLRDELARRPAAFVEPEPDKPNPFRDFTTDRRRMGPL